MTYKFNHPTQIMMDRSYVDFGGVEFTVIHNTPHRVEIELTPEGISTYTDQVKGRNLSEREVPFFGADNHLVNFLTEELKGRLTFLPECDYQPELFYTLRKMVSVTDE